MTAVTGADGTVGGTVPATLSLTLGPAASFGAFTPGVAKEYAATTSANVISTAGDAALSGQLVRFSPASEPIGEIRREVASQCGIGPLRGRAPRPGFLGSVVINQRVTEVGDTAWWLRHGDRRVAMLAAAAFAFVRRAPRRTAASPRDPARAPVPASASVRRLSAGCHRAFTRRGPPAARLSPETA